MDICISVVISHMKRLSFFAVFTICLLLASSYFPVYAVDLNAELSSKGTAEKPVFRFMETAFVDYHNGGKLKEQLYGKNVTVSFQTNSTNPGIRDLIARINTNL